jgi:HlyD family secretion protein
MKKRISIKKWILVSGGLLLVLGAWLGVRNRKPKEVAVPVIKVQEGPLTISVTSAGSIQSRDKVVIANELEGHNTVIWVIDEGVNVKPGDLLVEFNASHLIEKRNEQEISVGNIESALTVTREKLEITKGDCEASQLDSEVELQLAKMEREKYEQGDFPQLRRQYESDMALADEEVQRATEKLDWSKRLAEASFLTRTDLQADQLELKRRQIQLEMAQTKMSVLTNYTVLQQKATLSSRLRKAERAQIRIAWQNKATLRQVESELRARGREYDRATNRLAELNVQIEKSKIFAPTNGIVLYASTVQISRRQWWVKPLAVGGSVVERQELIYIPLESGMVVETMAPEASLTKVTKGMSAKIKIDAFPGRVFDGKLVKIGILPDGQSSSLNPDLKLYKCEIECDFQDVTIRPGMSCDVELVKDSYDKVMYVPVQCVVRENGMPILYVRRNGVWTAQMVRVGFDNNRMIRIIDGVKVGEEVMMAPPIKESKSEDKDSQQMEDARRRMKARAQEDDALDQPPPLKSKKRKPVVKEDDPTETKTPGTGENKTEVNGDVKTEAHHEKKRDAATVGIVGTSTKETGT